MREETTAPTVPEVPTESYEPVLRADGGHRAHSFEAGSGAPLVPDLS